MEQALAVESNHETTRKSPIYIFKLTFTIKRTKLSEKNTTVKDGIFGHLYQTFGKEITPVLYKFLQKIEEEHSELIYERK